MLRRLFNLFKLPHDPKTKTHIKVEKEPTAPYVSIGGKHARAKHRKGRDLTKNHPFGIVAMNQHDFFKSKGGSIDPL